MIKLEDISIYRFKAGLFFEYRKLFELLENYNVENYQQLSNLIEYCDSIELDYLILLKKELTKVIEQIQRLNKLDINYKNDTCFYSLFDNTEIDKFSLEKTDKEILCNRLIFLNPNSFYTSVKMNDFFCFSVYQTKSMINKYWFSDNSKKIQNALIANIRGFGANDIKKVRQAIVYYEQQVIRQAMECRLDNVNYFDLNKKEKEMIINDNYKEIIEYLVSVANVCIWGNLTDSNKKRLLKSISTKGFELGIIRENYINILSDYTTLSELENGKISSKILQRFIIG